MISTQSTTEVYTNIYKQMQEHIINNQMKTCTKHTIYHRGVDKHNKQTQEHIIHNKILLRKKTCTKNTITTEV